ncbi:hypothetical protein [Xylanimonas ulmi]|uniref:Uncharacterized protein n=1 Tax=Xylanimonas ulmi TaxID=228973 RepID=A0A4Q7M345_9MICO|nr:hypothetical protein [Xylanibacterium ulmi]RZS61731.1 hypothetical protein EV386_2042 [Xylanibacterium ulmi]
MGAQARLSDLLARLSLFSGPAPAPPGATWPGAVPHVPDDVAAALAELSDASRRSVLDPLGRTGPSGRVGYPTRVSLPFLARGAERVPTAPARQIDETTCGAAVLTALAMAGDPRLALRVARDPQRQFAALQRRAHRACARELPPWPRRYGTAPWAAAAVARFAGVRYTHRVVGAGERGAAVLAAAVAAAASGVPVPLFSGGDLGGGWQTAAPRHVVLLVDARDEAGGVVRLYEPSSATAHTVPTSALLAPEQARERGALTAALGAWPHVVWALLPR